MCNYTDRKSICQANEQDNNNNKNKTTSQNNTLEQYKDNMIDNVESAISLEISQYTIEFLLQFTI